MTIMNSRGAVGHDLAWRLTIKVFIRICPSRISVSYHCALILLPIPLLSPFLYAFCFSPNIYIFHISPLTINLDDFVRHLSPPPCLSEILIRLPSVCLSIFCYRYSLEHVTTDIENRPHNDAEINYFQYENSGPIGVTVLAVLVFGHRVVGSLAGEPETLHTGQQKN